MPAEINRAGYDLIKEFEGLRLRAYLCPAGVWTIGYGHTGPDVTPNRVITLKEAQALLDHDLDWAEACVEQAAPDANDNEFAAMVSLTFNIGADGFKKSTVLRLHKAGDKLGAARAFRMWNKATVSGKLTELPGLTRRRLAEEALYLTPASPVFQEQAMPQAVAPEAKAVTSKTAWTAGTVLAAGTGNLGEQLTPEKIAAAVQAVESLTDSTQSVVKLVSTVGPIVLGLVIVGGAAFVLIRHVMQKRSGRVQS